MSAQVVTFPSRGEIEDLLSQIKSRDLVVEIALELQAEARREYERVARRPAPQVQS